MHAISAPVSGISLTLQLQAEILSAQIQSRARSDFIRRRVHSGARLSVILSEPVSAIPDHALVADVTVRDRRRQILADDNVCIIFLHEI
jgi:hypothetical protein